MIWAVAAACTIGAISSRPKGTGIPRNEGFPEASMQSPVAITDRTVLSLKFVTLAFAFLKKLSLLTMATKSI